MRSAIILTALLAAGTATAQVNTVYGQQAAASELYDANITVFGYQAMYACQYCYGTTAMGYQALRVSSGNYNTAMGIFSMYNSTSGYGNVGVGAYTLQNLGTGSQNVAVGYNAGSCATVNGSNNIFLNNCGKAKDNNVIRIGTQGVQTFAQIAGIYNVKLNSTLGGQALYVNANGQIGVLSTTIHHTAATATAAAATQTDIATLRSDLVATKNMVYSLQREVAQLRATKATR